MKKKTTKIKMDAEHTLIKQANGEVTFSRISPAEIASSKQIKWYKTRIKNLEEIAKHTQYYEHACADYRKRMIEAWDQLNSLEKNSMTKKPSLYYEKCLSLLKNIKYSSFQVQIEDLQHKVAYWKEEALCYSNELLKRTANCPIKAICIMEKKNV